MSRLKFWAYVKDEEGEVVPSAGIGFYLNGTNDLATIYSTPVSAADDEIDQTSWTADDDGYFEFFVGDSVEVLPNVGYDVDQLFDLRWHSPDNVKYGNIDNLQLFFQLYEADPTDEFDTVKNKLVSNEDSYTWSTHVEETWFHQVHQLEPADFQDQQDVTYNKLVSNKLMNDIYRDLDSYRISGGGVRYIECVGAVGQEFYTDPGDWVADGDYYSYTVAHGFRFDNPIVTVWDSNRRVFIPVRIEQIDENTLKVYSNTQLERVIFIVGERYVDVTIDFEENVQMFTEIFEHLGITIDIDEFPGTPQLILEMWSATTEEGGGTVELWTRIYPTTDKAEEQSNQVIFSGDSRSAVDDGYIYVQADDIKVAYSDISDDPSRIYRYDTTLDTWTLITSTGPDRKDCILEEMGNGKLYVHGGYSNPINWKSDTWSYNISADTWTQISTAGPLYTKMTSTSKHENSEEKIFIYGMTNITYTTTEDMWQYDVLGDAWTLLSSSSPLSFNDTLRMIYYDDKIYCVSSDEMYTFNLSGNNWSSSLPFPFISKVYYHSVTLLDGVIYLVGGYSNAIYNLEVWSYDIELNTWQQLTDLPYGIYGHFLENVSGSLYCGGANSCKNYMLKYDPIGDEFETLNTVMIDNFIPSRISYINFEYNDLLYILNGYRTYKLNDQWIYNPYTDTSTMLASGSIKRLWDPSISVLNNKAYVFGGYDLNTSSYSYKLFSFDVLTETWVQLANLPTSVGRRAPTSIIHNNILYVHGGRTGTSTYTDETWSYDISDDTWTLVSSAGPTVSFAPSVLYNNKMYLHGGTKGSYLNDTWSYSISGNTWTLVSTAGPTNAASKMKLYNDSLYIFGGILNSESWKYNILTNTWTQLSSIFGEELSNIYLNNTSSILSNGSIYTYGGSFGGTNIDDIVKYKIDEPSVITEVPSVFEKDDDAFPTSHHFSFNYNDEMYIYGGKKEVSVMGVNTMDDNGYISKYNYIDKTFTLVSTTGPERYDFVAGYYNGKLYVHGGRDGNTNYYSDTWSYNISADTWTQISTGGVLALNRATFTSNNEKLYTYRGYLTTTVTPNLYEYDMSSNNWTLLSSTGDVTSPDWLVYHNDKLYAHNTSALKSYDITGDSWSAALTHNSEHYLTNTKAVVYDDKIYMTTGSRLTTTLISNLIVAIYDITGDSWSYSNNYLLSDAVYTNLIEYNDKLYTYSGGDGSYLSPTYMQVYDIIGDTWSYDNVEKAKSFLEFSGAYNLCELYNNEVFIFHNDTYNNTWKESKFNIDTNTSTLITSASSLPIGLHKATAINNDKIYFFGSSNSSYDDILYVYDTSTNLLSTVSTYSGHGRYICIMEVYNDKLYIHGGFDVVKNAYTYDTIEYDISGDTWTVVSSADGGTGMFMSSTISGSNIYTYGGQTTSDDLWKFDISTSTWTLLSSTGGPLAFFGHSIYTYNNSLYVFGGVSTSKTIWKFDLLTNTWTELSDSFDKTLKNANSVIRNNIVFFFNGIYGVVNNDKVLRYKIE